MWAMRSCPEVREVVDGERGAGGVVVGHAVDARLARPARDEHHRQLAARAGDGLHVEHRAGEDQPVDAQLEQGVERAALAARPAVDDARDGPVALRPRLHLDAVDDVGEERVVEVGEDDAEQVGAAADEAPRGGVGPVAERRRGVEHEAPLRLAHGAGAAEDERDQRLRHARAGGDVDDGRAGRRGRAHRRGLGRRDAAVRGRCRGRGAAPCAAAAQRQRL
jgi:hypothetical protein